MAGVASTIAMVIVAGLAVRAARRRQATQYPVPDEPHLVEPERERVDASGYATRREGLAHAPA